MLRGCGGQRGPKAAPAGGEAAEPWRQYLDEPLELSVLLQEPRLLLLQGEDILCCLLENGCLGVGGGEGQNRRG